MKKLRYVNMTTHIYRKSILLALLAPTVALAEEEMQS
jgi:hypothetical protein